MPRGGRRRNAGRKRGTSARTLALNAIARETNAIEQRKAKSPGLGIDVLRTLLSKCIALAEYYEPATTGKPNRHADADRFERWCSYIRMVAAELTKYESPRLHAVTVASTPEMNGEPRKRFTLTVFETPRRRLAPPVIEHETNGASSYTRVSNEHEDDGDEVLDDFGRKLPEPE